MSKVRKPRNRCATTGRLSSFPRRRASMGVVRQQCRVFADTPTRCASLECFRSDEGARMGAGC